VRLCLYLYLVYTCVYAAVCMRNFQYRLALFSSHTHTTQPHPPPHACDQTSANDEHSVFRWCRGAVRAHLSGECSLGKDCCTPTHPSLLLDTPPGLCLCATNTVPPCVYVCVNVCVRACVRRVVFMYVSLCVYTCKHLPLRASGHTMAGMEI